jgi:hypothetical protein
MLFDPSAALRVTLAADAVEAGVPQAASAASRLRSAAKA